MSRKPLNRHETLYTRISNDNAKFIKRICKETKKNKTDWMNKHFDFLRTTYGMKAAHQIAETRNKI